MNWDKLLLLIMVLSLASHWSSSRHLTLSWALIGCRQMNQFPADRQRKWVQSWPGQTRHWLPVKSKICSILYLPENGLISFNSFLFEILLSHTLQATELKPVPRYEGWNIILITGLDRTRHQAKLTNKLTWRLFQHQQGGPGGSCRSPLSNQHWPCCQHLLSMVWLLFHHVRHLLQS